MNYKSIIGGNIRKVRLEQGWTQEKLAIRSQVTYEYINRLENGKMNVSIETLLRIAKALKTPFASLVDGLN